MRRVWGVGLIARPFDREAWLRPGESHGEGLARRERMVRNLVKRHLRAGMTRAEVEALIGPPDEDPPLAAREPGEWIYMLGPDLAARLRMLFLMFRGTDPSTAEGFGELAGAVSIRSLRLGFDGDRLVRVEIQSM